MKKIITLIGLCILMLAILVNAEPTCQLVDSDNDGIGDQLGDNCPVVSNPNQLDCDNDNIGDACDTNSLCSTDSDNDGYMDSIDKCPSDSEQWTDLDNDKVCDELDDKCPSDSEQWTDLDNDLWCDEIDDACSNDKDEHLDTDGDLVCDGKDAFPGDITESEDIDNDGIGNNADQCPNTQEDIIEVDSDGCASYQICFNEGTVCPDICIDDITLYKEGECDFGECTYKEAECSFGCSAETAQFKPTIKNTYATSTDITEQAQCVGDSDADGIGDDLDTCSNTPTDEEVDESGCSCSQKDSDGDSVNNCIDECPNTEAGKNVNDTGCKKSNWIIILAVSLSTIIGAGYYLTKRRVK